MSTKSNPGRFNCYAAAFPDETIFTILARDPAFPSTVEFWVAERIRLGKNETEDDRDRLSAALEEAKTAAKWREDNLDPFGDGEPTWRQKMNFVDDQTSRPVSMLDGDEAIRLNRVWLTGLVEKLETANGPNAVREVAESLSLALGRTTLEYNGTAQEVDSAFDPDELGGRVPGTDDWGKDSYSADPENRTVVKDETVIDEKPHDLAHSPEVPPHRFAQFHKGDRYAYAKGLEVNPIHLPVVLDEMSKDGWSLVSIFGATDSKHVGFIFERQPGVVMLQPPAFTEEDQTLIREFLGGRRIPVLRPDQPLSAPKVRDGLDAEVEVHIAATRETHAKDAADWVSARLRSPYSSWPVNARVVGLIDGRSERAFDFQCGPMVDCQDRGNAFQP